MALQLRSCPALMKYGDFLPDFRVNSPKRMTSFSASRSMNRSW
jgi:hypothetical protein